MTSGPNIPHSTCTNGLHNLEAVSLSYVSPWFVEPCEHEELGIKLRAINRTLLGGKPLTTNNLKQPKHRSELTTFRPPAQQLAPFLLFLVLCTIRRHWTICDRQYYRTRPRYFLSWSSRASLWYLRHHRPPRAGASKSTRIEQLGEILDKCQSSSWPFNLWSLSICIIWLFVVLATRVMSR